MCVPLDTQATPGTLRADGSSLGHVPERVRPSERRLQLGPAWERPACAAAGRVGRDELHLRPRVLQVWRLVRPALQPFLYLG